MMATKWSLGYVAIGLLLAIVTPFIGPYMSILLIGTLAVALLLVSLRDKPNAILSVWILSVALTPPWISFQFVGYRIPFAAIISFGIVLVLLGRRKVTWHWCDTSVLALAITAIVATALFSSPLHLTTQVLFEWVSCYAAGRFMFAGADFPRVANRLGGIIGWLALVQMLLKFNVSTFFIFSLGSADGPWKGLQERGGQIRAELTFGHSISLGATLCLLLPFALAMRSRISDKAMIAGIIVGIVATSSRSSMVAGVIVLILTLVASNASGIAKFAGSVGMGLATWIGSNLFLQRISQAENSAELTDSTAYREGLLDLLNIVRLIGLAPGGVPAPDGVTYVWSSFYSIDNGILYVGLYLGWLAAACYVSGVIFVAWRGYKGSSKPFSIALIAQIPLILTVAPITQYQNYYWMVLGAGASAVIANRNLNGIVQPKRGVGQYQASIGSGLVLAATGRGQLARH